MKRYKAIYSLLLIAILFIAVAILLADQFEQFGQIIHERFGPMGIFATIYFLDVVIQPFPPDILIYSNILSESTFWITVSLGALMSVLGGITGYWIGRLLQYEGAIRFIGQRTYTKAHNLFVKYGFWAVLIGSLSPVPFNAMCWTAGVFNMPFRYFVVSVVVTRPFRYVLVGLLAIAMA